MSWYFLRAKNALTSFGYLPEDNRFGACSIYMLHMHHKGGSHPNLRFSTSHSRNNFKNQVTYNIYKYFEPSGFEPVPL